MEKLISPNQLVMSCQMRKSHEVDTQANIAGAHFDLCISELVV